MIQNKKFTLIGATGTGKTPFITGGDFEPGLAALYLKKGMSTLAIDEIDHVRYRDFKILHPDSYRSTLSPKPGKYRTIAAVHHIEDIFRRMSVEKSVWNTFIDLEDYQKYLNNPLTDFQKVLYGNSKQQNNDIAASTWAWGFLTPDIARFTNYYVIFKTGDSPETRKGYLKGCYDKVMRAWDMVMAGKYPYLIVNSGL